MKIGVHPLLLESFIKMDEHAYAAEQKGFLGLNMMTKIVTHLSKVCAVCVRSTPP